MHYDPNAIFTAKDIRRAGRLNKLLKWVPRYRTSGRFNARFINGMCSVGRHLAAEPANIGVMVKSLSVNGGKLPIRVLFPEKPRALLLHFHGGAWVIGDSKLDDNWNVEYVRRCRVAVASANFHLATDDDLAQTIRDAHAFTRWALDSRANFGVDKVFLEGESSGAHLAASSLVRLSRSRSLECIAGLVSYCGAFDLSGPASLKLAADSLVIDPQAAGRNLDRLLEGSPSLAVDDPVVSPLRADLIGMPPGLFIAGQLDPIIGDSRSMQTRWQDVCGNADLLVVPEGPHGFHRFPTRLAARTKTVAVEWINRRLRNEVQEASFNA
ncbi:alpha/beta hydrolase [Rhizobium sp. XQZ8]|uniref:alpha/beta hydrolase n=1 Tax=Rhizobium populisoli TaxID=2859785 RepID=UPI001C671DEF|nr:alpha/beta hydrolase fold domain-containing protein [Rhizobium populisoli]MBW6425361.1 alpha/beta hydrolase [Rhizobium populisoli]